MGLADECACFLDGDGGFFGGNEGDVGVGSGQCGVAGLANAAAACRQFGTLAHQCRGKSQSRVGTAGARWAGQQPGVRGLTGLGSTAQLGHHGVLPLQINPDAHALPTCPDAAARSAALVRMTISAVTRCSIASASSATDSPTGSTRYRSGWAAASSRKAARMVA